MKKNNGKSALALMAVLAAANFPANEMPPSCKMPAPLKNKYDLTEDQIELMSEMTPKEKKKFLRGLGK